MGNRSGVKLLGLTILLLTVAAAAVACQRVCNADCASPGYDIYTPAGLPSPLVDVTTDPPCVVNLLPVDGGPAQVQVTDDSATQGAVCVLHGRLADGQTVTATVTFGQASDPSCCPVFPASGGEFTVSDAGISGG